MNKLGMWLTALGMFGMSALFQSCLDDDDNSLSYNLPTALVTVCPGEDGSFVMNLDDSTTLRPTNVKTSPFGKKEVRALVNYSVDDASRSGKTVKDVKVNWLDSIRTKLPVVSVGDNAKEYGDDPVEVVRDWVTVAEDGYLTLRVRTNWSSQSNPHTLNLVTGVNPGNPMEMELRHDAHGDLYGAPGDALVAFNLNGLPGLGEKARIKLRWKSYSGEKSVEFDLKMRQRQED